MQYTFFGGKGGVGKTTCATAAAVKAAHAGRRILIVSTDPAHSLGDALAMRLSAKPTRVAALRTSKHGSLHAVELDADKGLERWMLKRKRSLQSIAEAGTYLDSEDIGQLLELSLPGVDELVGLIELRRLAHAGKYDQIVVDTAPTGHTLRLLEMPETLQRIAAVFDNMQAKQRFLSESLGGAYRPSAADELITEIDREGSELIEMLRDPHASKFVWVLLPEMMALEETKDGIAALAKQGITVSEIVVNRVKRQPVEPCPACSKRVQTEATAIKAIRTNFKRVSILFVPQVEQEPRGVAAFRAFRGAGFQPAQAVRRAGWKPAPRLEPLTDWIETLAPPGCRLLMFGGKGGVGKTTCAAAGALVLAERNRQRKILLLSTDPAHSLGDVLKLPLDGEERPLRGFPSLRAQEMDAPSLLQARRERYLRSVNELFDTLQGGSGIDAVYDRAVARDLIDLSPPGIDEIFGILSVSEALLPRKGRAPKYDLVVLDTAPTGHALRLLEMPATALEWVRTLLSILLKYRKVTGLGSLATDLLEIARQMRQLLALLHDPKRTRLVAVTRAAQLPLLETSRLLRKVKQLKIAVSAVVVNAVTVPECASCRHAAAQEEREMNAWATEYPRILAPGVVPPPRGARELRRWARSWKRRTT